MRLTEGEKDLVETYRSLPTWAQEMAGRQILAIQGGLKVALKWADENERRPALGEEGGPSVVD